MIRWRGGKRSIHPAGLSHSTSVGTAMSTAPAPTAGEDHVEVIALRNSRAIGRVGREAVAFDDRDPLEVVGQGLGGEQAGHPGAEHDGVIVVRSSGPHGSDDAPGAGSGASDG